MAVFDGHRFAMVVLVISVTRFITFFFVAGATFFFVCGFIYGFVCSVTLEIIIKDFIESWLIEEKD